MHALKAGILGAVLVTIAPSAAQGAERCNKIVDAAARLACYDARHGAPAAPAGSFASPAPATAVATPPIRSSRRARSAQHAPLQLDSRVVAVRPALHGYWLVTLADGRSYETTQSVDAPEVGQAVHLRHTFLGTTFIDIHGRPPITVRLVQRSD
jgi:hypothetical protein